MPGIVKGLYIEKVIKLAKKSFILAIRLLALRKEKL
tara:strand:+ start:68 stop:175 length:108 start_codon:yes stop_codon:yes gene_type:complete